MKLLARILPVILILSLIAVGCKKPMGVKRIREDLTFHWFSTDYFDVPYCDTASSYGVNSGFRWPYGRVISDIDTFDYYFGCIDTTNWGEPDFPAQLEADFIDFNDHDLIIFNVNHSHVLMDSYRITNKKLFKDKEEDILYLMYTEHYRGAGSNEVEVHRLYFVEIPKGYAGFEVQYIPKFRRSI